MDSAAAIYSHEIIAIVGGNGLEIRVETASRACLWPLPVDASQKEFDDLAIEIVSGAPFDLSNDMVEGGFSRGPFFPKCTSRTRHPDSRPHR